MKKLITILASLALALPSFSATQGVAVRALDGASTNQTMSKPTVVDTIAAPKVYSNEVEATNASSLTLKGGGVEMTLGSGAVQVVNPYYFSAPFNVYDATTWNNSTRLATENDVRDKIESIVAGAGITAETATNIVTANALSKTNTAFDGLIGPNDQNMGRQIYLPLRYRNGLPPRRLFFGDNSVMDGSFAFGGTVVSNLNQATPRNGSIIGNSTYIYSGGNGTHYAAAYNGPLSPWNYWGLEDGEAFTNLTQQTPNGIPTTTLSVGYWAGNGFGTFDVNTNVAVNGVFGAQGTVTTVDANNGGALTFMLTNINIPLATVFASVTAHGTTNIVQGQVGQYNTNRFSGHITDFIALSNGDWEYTMTNSVHSNWWRITASQYDFVGVIDKGSPNRGMASADGLWSSAALLADLTYIVPQATTNQLGASTLERSNVIYAAHIYGRPVYDLFARFLPIEPEKQTALYEADAVHLSAAGGAIAAQKIIQDFNWSHPDYVGFGYTNALSGNYALLAGGNNFSGQQTVSNTVISRGTLSGFTLWRRDTDTATANFSWYANGPAVHLNDAGSGNVDLLLITNNSGAMTLAAAAGYGSRTLGLPAALWNLYGGFVSGNDFTNSSLSDALVAVDANGKQVEVVLSGATYTPATRTLSITGGNGLTNVTENAGQVIVSTNLTIGGTDWQFRVVGTDLLLTNVVALSSFLFGSNGTFTAVSVALDELNATTFNTGAINVTNRLTVTNSIRQPFFELVSTGNATNYTADWAATVPDNNIINATGNVYFSVIDANLVGGVTKQYVITNVYKASSNITAYVQTNLLHLHGQTYTVGASPMHTNYAIPVTNVVVLNLQSIGTTPQSIMSFFVHNQP